MKAFEIGYVPQGWEKGQKLRITKAREGDKHNRELEGVVEQFYDFETVFPPLGTELISLNDIAQVRFSYRNAEEVSAWLKWWYGIDDDQPLTKEKPA